MVASSGVPWINTLIANCMLHIMTAFVSYCMNQDGAVYHNSLQLTMYHRWMLIFVNWCIRCGVCWMFLIMLSLEQHHVLICLLFHLFLEGGVTFYWTFSILYFFVFYCSACIITVSWATSLLQNWMNEWIILQISMRGNCGLFGWLSVYGDFDRGAGFYCYNQRCETNVCGDG